MQVKEILNDQTLNDAFNHLIEKEPLFKKVLDENNYEINPFNKKKGLSLIHI